MAINDNRGSNMFDPSRKVRDILGDRFVDSTEQEALERLSQASKTAVRNNNIRREDEMGGILDKIKHSSGMKPESNGQNTNSEQFEERLKYGRRNVEEQWMKMTTRKTFFDNVLLKTMGVSKNNGKSENFDAIKNGVFRFASDAVSTYSSNKVLKENNVNLKDASIAVGISSFTDMISSVFGSTNNTTLNKVFNSECITKAESDIVNNEIRKAKVKYAIEHVGASVVLPAMAKIGADKLIKSTENSNVSKICSYGTFSAIGKSALYVIRKINEKKLDNEVNILPAGADSETYYKTFSKAVTNKVINTQIDPTILSGIVGTICSFASKEEPKPVEVKREVKSEEKPAIKVTAKKPVKKPTKKVSA